MQSDAELRDLLRRVRSIAVLGVKDGAGDDAFRVVQDRCLMVEHRRLLGSAA